MKAYIITGTTHGLGKALLDIVSKNNFVISIVRYRIDDINENVKKIICDLSDIDAVKKVEFFTQEELSKIDDIIFINNAGMIEPISDIGKIDEDILQNSLNVNIVSPIFLINKLVSQVDKKLTVLNISSGAANYPIQSWSVYCSAKAAIKMFANVLKEEGIKVVNIDPGIMDTNMQSILRKSEFPKQREFISYKKNNQLKSPESVAKKILEEYTK